MHILLFYTLRLTTEDVWHASDIKASLCVIVKQILFYQWAHRSLMVVPQSHHPDQHVCCFSHPFCYRLESILSILNNT